MCCRKRQPQTGVGSLVNCLVHIRRHFEQALDENREMAEYGLTQIQKIYQIEHGCNDAGLSYEERKNKRQELARPILEAMKAWMEAEGVKYSRQDCGYGDRLAGGSGCP